MTEEKRVAKTAKLYSKARVAVYLPVIYARIDRAAQARAAAVHIPYEDLDLTPEIARVCIEHLRCVDGYDVSTHASWGDRCTLQISGWATTTK